MAELGYDGERSFGERRGEIIKKRRPSGLIIGAG